MWATASRRTSTGRSPSCWTRRPGSSCWMCSPTPVTRTSSPPESGRRSTPIPPWPAGWRSGRGAWWGRRWRKPTGWRRSVPRWRGCWPGRSPARTRREVSRGRSAGCSRGSPTRTTNGWPRSAWPTGKPCPLPGNPRGLVSSQAAETDPTLLDAAELHVADLVGRHHDLPVLVVREDEQPAIGQGLGQGALDLLRGSVRLDHELPGNRLNPDLDFHGAPLGCLVLGSAVLRSAVFTRPRPAADPPPRQPGYQLLGGVLGDLLAGAEPEGGTGLGHADQPHAQQVRLVVADPRVLPDDLADDLRAVACRRLQPVADGGLVTQV